MDTIGHWYAANTSGDQGLVIEEHSGTNIAVTYDASDAVIVAIAPEAIELLIETLAMLENMTTDQFSKGMDKPIRNKIILLLANIGLSPDGEKQEA